MSEVCEAVIEPTDRDVALAMAARLVVQCEGTCLKPYRDSAGHWTIGCGTTVIDGVPVGPNTPAITIDRAYDLMMVDLAATQAAVDATLTAPASVGQRAALYSFAYNEGANAERSSTVLRLFNAGDVAGSADALLAWNLASDPATHKLVVSAGLTNRRKLERAVFLGETVV